MATPLGRPRPAAGTSARPADKGLPELGRELVDLTVAYAKQETVEPLRSLGRQVGLGLLGAVIASTGLVFALVGVLRLVQVETTWVNGFRSVLPYGITLVVAVLVAGLALKKIGGRRDG